MAMVRTGTAAERKWLNNESTGFSRSLALKASYVLLHQLDLILTIVAVSLGFTELNPLMRALLAAPVQLIVIKVFIPLVIVWLCPNRLLIPAAAFLFLVVLWNVKELLVLLV